MQQGLMEMRSFLFFEDLFPAAWCGENSALVGALDVQSDIKFSVICIKIQPKKVNSRQNPVDTRGEDWITNFVV